LLAQYKFNVWLELYWQGPLMSVIEKTKEVFRHATITQM